MLEVGRGAGWINEMENGIAIKKICPPTIIITETLNQKKNFFDTVRSFSESIYQS